MNIHAKERYEAPATVYEEMDAGEILCASIEAERGDYGDPVNKTW